MEGGLGDGWLRVWQGYWIPLGPGWSWSSPQGASSPVRRLHCLQQKIQGEKRQQTGAERSSYWQMKAKKALEGASFSGSHSTP